MTVETLSNEALSREALSREAFGSEALLNCLVREVSCPEDQVRGSGSQLIIRLARSAVVLRAGTRRPSAGIGPRLAGSVEVCADGSWRQIGCVELARLIAAEMTLASGIANPEFVAQVASSQAALAALQVAPVPRVLPVRPGPDGRVSRFLASEQALVAGHRFHPAPKAREGTPEDWLRYAPEAGARFPLRFLGVRSDVLAGSGDTSALDQLGGPVPPQGYRLLPAHPWQFRLLGQSPWLRSALSAGLLIDLGAGTRDVVPTSSVRTVYDPVADMFCKFSLNVRLTNCVRKSAWYELDGSVILTSLLAPLFAGLGDSAVLLGEPGYRTVALTSREAYEGLAVIVRDGIAARVPARVTPLLAASLTVPPELFRERSPELFRERDADWLLGWWLAYVRLVAAPVLGAFFQHGVVLEPHLQNVLVGVDEAGWPVRVIFRDLEGVKLVADSHATLLDGLPSGIARGLGYDAQRGWDRVAYCLFVNHLAEIAAAIADRCSEPDLFERALWRGARDELTVIAKELRWPPQLRALLAGVPLPAKANMGVRWARAADREAQYVPVTNPLRDPDFPC
jgi:siderophore synthetase component